MKTTRLIALAGLAMLTAMQAQGYAQQAHVVPTGYLVQQPGGGNMVLFAGGQYEDFQDEGACDPDCCEPPCCEPPCCEPPCCQPTCCEPTCCGTCDGYGCGESCGCPKWQFFGEFLYMRPRNAEVNFGDMHGSQTGIIDFDYKPAFRAGCSRAVSDCSSVGVSYTYLYTDTSDLDSISTIDATHSIDVDLVDIDYRRVFSCSELHTLTCLVGARYSSLSQKFSSQSYFPNVWTFLTDIDFEGAGIRVGLEGERYASNCGLMVYGRGAASFVAGEFRAHYQKMADFSRPIAETDWKAGRIVTMLDLEVGVGWTSSNGLLRVTGGYMVSGWFNTVKTDKFNEAAEWHNFVGLGDTLTFDGLTARAELRF